MRSSLYVNPNPTIVRVILEWDEETRSHSATCPELNFVSSCGDTKEEAISNLQEAIALLLEPLPDELRDLDSSEAIDVL